GSGGRGDDERQKYSAQLERQIAKTAQQIGSRKIGPIEDTDTFFFWDGRYIARSYTIRREGYKLYLNGVEIDRVSPIPEGYQENLPELPKHITGGSSWEDVDKLRVNGKRWDSAFVGWFYWHYPKDEASKRVVQALRELPFVKEVEWVPAGQNKRYLRIVSHAGDERHYFTSWWNPKNKSEFDYIYGVPDVHRPNSIEYVEYLRDLLEQRMDSLEEVLRSGDLMFVSEHGPLRVSREGEQELKRWQEIVNVVAILKSNLPEEEKVREIVERLATRRFEGAPAWNVARNLVRNFQGHPQLDQRIDELRKTVDIPLWKPPAE
ncbi:MAG: hypothetical protein ACREQV_02275, partial [Candidatus Binatia bacterium]